MNKKIEIPDVLASLQFQECVTQMVGQVLQNLEILRGQIQQLAISSDLDKDMRKCVQSSLDKLEVSHTRLGQKLKHRKVIVHPAVKTQVEVL